MSKVQKKTKHRTGNLKKVLRYKDISIVIITIALFIIFTLVENTFTLVTDASFFSRFIEEVVRCSAWAHPPARYPLDDLVIDDINEYDMIDIYGELV